jgi:hypothetical protein
MRVTFRKRKVRGYHSMFAFASKLVYSDIVVTDGGEPFVCGSIGIGSGPRDGIVHASVHVDYANHEYDGKADADSVRTWLKKVAKLGTLRPSKHLPAPWVEGPPPESGPCFVVLRSDPKSVSRVFVSGDPKYVTDIIAHASIPPDPVSPWAEEK